MLRRLLALGLLALGLAASPHGAEAANVKSVEVAGTEFRVALDDGRVLGSPDLVGAVLAVSTSGGPVRLRIEAVERDSSAARDPAWLHRFSVQAPDGAWANPCKADAEGRRLGFPLVGRAQADGLMLPAPDGVFELVCTSGAQGKCVRFGYLPWQGDAALARYNACVRMVRADYSGTGTPTTRNGTQIYVYDDVGIETKSPGDDDPENFEAGWAPTGAVCVRHVRIKENVSLPDLEQLPGLAGKTGAICTEAFAREHGAVVFNASRR